MFFSIIIPVYNRPEEISELLESLTHQTFSDFEILVIDDGSVFKAQGASEKFKETLNVRYYFKQNTGQGFSRNFGLQLAKGDFFIILDSDCIIPSGYLENVKKVIDSNNLDAFGGPDKEHPSFTNIQKAISYSMTSVYTTGGIRGRKKHAGTFHPRSFNMGFSRKVFEKTNGFVWTRLGEDLELSIRIIKAGFKTSLIEDAFVFHKRRTNFIQFFKQLHFFGKARINVYIKYKEALKLIHCLPAAFACYLVFCLGISLFKSQLSLVFIIPLGIFTLLIFFDAAIKYRSILIGLQSVVAAYIQLIAYGIGFLHAFISRIVLKKKESIKFC